MIMFKRKIFPALAVALVYSSVEYGKGDSCPIDQSPIESFNIDPATGRAMSDITRLMRAQSELEKNNILKSLKERKGFEGFNDLEALKNDIKYFRPYLAQLPSELADYTESVFKQQMEERSKLKEDERKRLDSLMSDDAYKMAQDYLEEKERQKKIAELSNKQTA